MSADVESQLAFLTMKELGGLSHVYDSTITDAIKSVAKKHGIEFTDELIASVKARLEIGLEVVFNSTPKL